MKLHRIEKNIVEMSDYTCGRKTFEVLEGEVPEFEPGDLIEFYRDPKISREVRLYQIKFIQRIKRDETTLTIFSITPVMVVGKERVVAIEDYLQRNQIR